MSRRKSDAALTALAIGGTLLTLGGFVAALALSKRATTEPSFGPLLQPTTGAPPGTDYSEDDLEAAARMLASENGTGSRALWAELIGSQLHARKPGETLFDRIAAGSGYGPQGEKSWPGKVRPVATGARKSGTENIGNRGTCQPVGIVFSGRCYTICTIRIFNTKGFQSPCNRTHIHHIDAQFNFICAFMQNNFPSERTGLRTTIVECYSA